MIACYGVYEDCAVRDCVACPRYAMEARKYVPKAVIRSEKSVILPSTRSSTEISTSKATTS